MILEQRVFHQASDLSNSVNDYRAGAAAFAYTTGQYLYIGQILPFNNLWFELGTLNAVAATTSVDIWFGTEWIPAVDVIDETAGLTATGRIQWTTDINKGWVREQKSSDVTGLSSTNVYDMFWIRMSFSANLTAGTTIKYIGQKFASDTILYSFYPDLNNTTIKSSFASGKTTWDEQHYMAAEHIVRDLKKANIIKARSQILDYSLFVDASCHKLASFVYHSFGKPYFDQKKEANLEYKAAMNLKNFNVDLNADGRLTDTERNFSTQFVTR